MKVLLINPPYSRLRGTKECTEMITPLGLSYIAAKLDGAGYDVSIYDANNSSRERASRFNRIGDLLGGYGSYGESLRVEDHPVWQEVEEKITSESPDLVGVSVLSPSLGASLKVAEISRRAAPDAPVVFGGFHPTCEPEGVLKSGLVDAVVRGEGEDTFAEIAARLEEGRGFEGVAGVSRADAGRFVHEADRELIRELDSLPSPARFIGASATGKIPLHYARGCPFSCKFCSDRAMWRRRVRYLSAGRLVDLVEEIIEETGVREFTFVDGTFNVRRDRVVEFCEEVIRRRLRILWDALVRSGGLDYELMRLCRRAGCAQMNLGVESGSPRVLEDLRKGVTIEEAMEDARRIRRAGIAAVSFFCVGMPPETVEDMRATRDAIIAMDHDYVIMHVFTPLPGSEYFEELKAAGALPEDHDYDLYGYKSPLNHFALRMAEQDFVEWRDRIAGAVNRVNAGGRLALKLLLRNAGFYARYPAQLWRRAAGFFGY